MASMMWPDAYKMAFERHPSAGTEEQTWAPGPNTTMPEGDRIRMDGGNVGAIWSGGLHPSMPGGGAAFGPSASFGPLAPSGSAFGPPAVGGSSLGALAGIRSAAPSPQAFMPSWLPFGWLGGGGGGSSQQFLNQLFRQNPAGSSFGQRQGIRPLGMYQGQGVYR